MFDQYIEALVNTALFKGIEKISTYLLELYQQTGKKNLILPLKRNELADYLNVSRPSMSREVCNRRDEGVIDFHLAAFQILDIEKPHHLEGTILLFGSHCYRFFLCLRL